MHKINRLLILFLITISSVTIVACQASYWKIAITGSRAVNPAVHQAELPLALRIYQLTKPQPFQRLTFKDLWKSDGEKLLDTYVDRKDVVVLPKTKHTIKILRLPGTKYIGVMALFKNRFAQGWRTIIPVYWYHSLLGIPINLAIVNQKIKLY